MKAVVAFVLWAVSRIFKIEVSGEHNVPEEGACIVCVNHISMFDPLVVLSVIKRPVRFIGKQELMKIPLLGSVLKYMNIIPIKRGSGDIGAVKASLRALKDGEALGIFPTGTREKKNPDAKPKAGVALIASKADVPVIPIHIDASYRIFSKVRITVGEAVDMTSYSGRKLTQDELADAANYIYESIKSLGDAV